MIAVQIKDVGQIELLDVEIPKVTPRHVLLKVNAASICGTDIHELQGEIPVQFPRILGHDFAGTIQEIGPGVTGFKEGDRVVVKPSFPCYKCKACEAGLHESCPNTKLIGLHVDGCFREYLLVPEANLIPMGDDISFEAASVLEPFTVGLNAFKRLNMNIGETVTVLGLGPIGLGLTKMAALSGAGHIHALDIRDDALQLASEFGATETINLATEAGKKQFENLSARGSDVVIETAGTPATVKMIPDLVKWGSKVVNIGIVKGIGAIPVEPIVMKALTIIGVGGNGGKGKYETALGLVSRGLIDPAKLVTHRFLFKDAIKAFKTAQSKEKGTIKVVIYA